jgi:cytochrome c biogenesis protein CcmG/thiol:disulfide interchange protein DsbE
MVIVAAAACAALVAAVVAVDSTTHRAAAVTAPAAPAFALPSLRDPAQQISLSAYRGRPVILNFFASWCGPCQRETPLLASFYHASGGKVVIIGVDADDKAPAARRFLQAKGVTYPVGFESTPAVADAYGVSAIGIPETFFLDSRHRIVKRIFGDVTMKELTAGTALMNSHNAAAVASAVGAAGDQNRG